VKRAAPAFQGALPITSIGEKVLHCGEQKRSEAAALRICKIHGLPRQQPRKELLGKVARSLRIPHSVSDEAPYGA
jgi:hypothetical protein